MIDVLTRIMEIAIECSFLECGYVNMEKLEYCPEVRVIYEGDMCRNYGTSWACPPAIGTITECIERVNQYNNMLVVSCKYELEDSFDI